MISAIILAAGESRRMGQPKMLLPWGDGTVLGQVLSTYRSAGVEDLLVVTGGAHEPVMKIVKQFEARSIFNEKFSGGEMLSSLQRGIQTLLSQAEVGAALIGLGDQPQVQEESVRSILEAFQLHHSALIVPSYQMKRGHPWLVDRSLWQELLEMKAHQSPRDFLNRHARDIHYVEVDTDSILMDLDTPDDYENARP